MAIFKKLFIGDSVATGNGKCFRKLSTEEPTSGANYLTFSSPNAFTLGIVDNTKYWDGEIEYSTNATNWKTWDGTNAIDSSADGKLYMRGTGNTQITGYSASSSKAKWVLTGSNIACAGNIETLLDYQTVADGEHPTMAAGCYYRMFRGCTALTTAPELPATTMADSCYVGMFRGCTALTTAPELPATTMADSCYAGMFRGCTALTTAPALPATTLAEACYTGMFVNCTSLTTVPELPATTLAGYCYQNIFEGCTQIKMSTTQTEIYHTAYRIPTRGTGTTASYALNNVFLNTGGTFTGPTTINTTYYTSNTVV